MITEVRSSGGIHLIPEETRHFERRRIFIEGEINHAQACTFVRQVLLLSEENAAKPIDVLINSVGGEISAGMLMYDVIQSCGTPIRMICLGRAYSMAAVLFASGNYGRYMLPHSELMLHEPQLGVSVSGSTSSLRSVSESLLQAKERMNKILVKHTGRSEEEIDKATAYDHFYTPEESVAFGLCDGIAGIGEVLRQQKPCLSSAA